MKRRLLTLTLVAALAGAPLAPSVASADVIERVIATVNDDAVFLSEVRIRALPFLRHAMQGVPEGEREARIEQLYTEVVEQLINERLIVMEARRLQIRITGDEVDRAIDGIRRSNNLSVDEFWEAIEHEFGGRERYRDGVRAQLARQRVLGMRLRNRVNVTTADVRRRYDTILREAESNLSFDVAHIIVPVPARASATELADAHARAEAVKAEVTPENFMSHGGVDLGTLRRGDLPEALEQALLVMTPGTISEPVRGPQGFHIFLLRSREDSDGSVPPFEEARATVESRLVEEAMVRLEPGFLAELRRNATITHAE